MLLIAALLCLGGCQTVPEAEVAESELSDRVRCSDCLCPLLVTFTISVTAAELLDSGIFPVTKPSRAVIAGAANNESIAEVEHEKAYFSPGVCTYHRVEQR